MMVVLLNSCKKENTSSTTDSISEEDAAEAITQSVSAESGGMTAQSYNAIEVTNTELSTLPCGITFDSSVSIASESGAAITYAANLSWNWTLTCNNLSIPEVLNFNISGSSSYNAPRMSSDDNSTASFKITGLQPSATAYTMNANYERNGTQQSKVLNKNSFSSTIILESTDLIISKTTQQITSGTATASISGASSSGKSFSYSGTVTFLGNKQATLVMASGNTYNIAW